MKRLWMTLRVIGALAVLTVSVSAQDYRARVQGSVCDEQLGCAAGRHGHADQRRHGGDVGDG